MVVTAVNSIKFNRYNPQIKFTGKKQKEDNQQPAPSYSKKAGKMVTIPAIVMMTLTPALTNAQTQHSTTQQVQQEQVQRKLTPEDFRNKSKMRRAGGEVIPVYPAGTDNAFGWKGLKNWQIRDMKRLKNQKKDYRMLFASTTNKIAKPKEVSEIYIVDAGVQGHWQDVAFPPHVKKIVYHNIGKDKEFCGVIVDGESYNEDGELLGILRREIRLADEDAQYIIDFLTNDTEWENKSYIKFEETTSSKTMAPHYLDD